MRSVFRFPNLGQTMHTLFLAFKQYLTVNYFALLLKLGFARFEEQFPRFIASGSASTLKLDVKHRRGVFGRNKI